MTKKKLKEIGGLGEVIEVDTIQIPFEKLEIIIDVDFAIMKNECPSLLPNRDMLINNLDISLQGSFLLIIDLRYPLVL